MFCLMIGIESLPLSAIENFSRGWISFALNKTMISDKSNEQPHVSFHYFKVKIYINSLHLIPNNNFST